MTSGAAPLFIPATGDRDIRFDAFYLDERNPAVPKSTHPVKSFFNKFTSTPRRSGYAGAAAMTSKRNFPNPLRDPALASVLPQVFKDLGLNSVETKNHFEDDRTYFIFVPDKLRDAYKAKAKADPKDRPRAKVALFFGVGPELDLFGLRQFFAASSDCVLITIPGIEAAWAGYGRAWGIGITTVMIELLMEDAGLTDIAFSVEVMAGYSTGYRGMNETIINKLVDLKALRRMIYLDAFYTHDDFPLAPKSSPHFKKNTAWAVDTALAASASAEVLIYGYTTGGTPRTDAKGTLKGPFAALAKAHMSKIKLIDLEFKQASTPTIATRLEAICLSRLIQGGIGDYFERKDVRADILAVVDALPERGALGTTGRSGFLDLYTWVGAAAQKSALATFPHDAAFKLVTRFKLLSDWTASSSYEFRHRDFVQEICKECLLP